MKYIAYMRKSQEQAERQSLSVPAQRRNIKERFPDLEIVEWIEESQSAFKLGREGFDDMLKLLDAKKAEGIVCWHPDRLSRNPLDAAQIVHRIGLGIIKDLKFGSYNFDNSPEGIMMLQMTMSQSQYYSAKLSKDVKRGNDEQRKRGWLTGRAIEGYLNVRADGGLDHGVIIKDPQRFDLRRKMWDLMLTGDYSVPQILTIVNEQWGYETRGDKKHPPGPLSRTGLYNMFKNPRYAGHIPVPGRPEDYEDATYPHMVSEEEFDRVQELLGSKGTRKLKARKVFTFKGIMICGECGCAITAEEKIRKYKNGKSQRFIYYHCTRKRPCSQKHNLNEPDLEAQFDAELSKRTILPQFKEWALEALADQNDVESTDIEAVLSTQNRAIESSHKQMKQLISMAAKEMIDEAEFRTEKKELEARIVTLEEELEDTKRRADSWYGTFTRTFELAVHGRERFMNGGIEVKKEIMADLGSNPVLLEGKFQFTPHPWLAPIENGYKQLEDEYLKVRTQPERIQKAAFAAISTTWLGW